MACLAGSGFGRQQALGLGASREYGGSRMETPDGKEAIQRGYPPARYRHITF